MELFEGIVKEYFLLNEGVSITAINNAINGLHPASIRYNSGGENKATGYRVIYPVAYGLTLAGNPVVRAFETGGDTASSNPGWKFFRVDRIIDWKNTKREYNPKSPELRGGFENLNSEGDYSMSMVYNIAPIGNARKINRNLGNVISSKPITKKDVENVKLPKETGKIEPNKQYDANDVVNNLISTIKSNNVDNVNTSSYIKNKGDKINAPETRPITKSDIGVDSAKENKPSNNDGMNKMTADEQPITKSDVNGNNELTNKFNDLMDRINNLDNEEENGNK